MKIYNVSNLAGLFHHFDTCADDVIVETADGRSYTWQDEKQVLHSLANSMEDSKVRQLSVRCQNREDVARIMDYLMECRCSQERLSA